MKSRRIVSLPHGSIGTVSREPLLDFGDPVLGDAIGLAPARAGLADAEEALGLERRERRIDLRMAGRPGARERALEEPREPVAAHRLGRDQPQERPAQTEVRNVSCGLTCRL